MGDVKALYPSLNIEQSVRICKKVIMESKLKFNNIDYRTAGIFLVVRMGPEGLKKVGLEVLTTLKLNKKGRPIGEGNWELIADLVTQEAKRAAELRERAKAE